MKVARNWVSIVALVFLSCSVTSCLEEINNIDELQFEWTPAFSFVLAQSTFDFIDFIENDTSEAIIQSGDNGLIILTYTEDLLSQSAGELFVLDEQSFLTSLLRVDPSASTGGVPVDTTINLSAGFTAVFGNNEQGEGESFDSLIVSNGLLRIQSILNFPADGFFTLTVPSLKVDGIPFSMTYSWERAEVNPIIEFDELINIAGYTIDLSDGQGGRDIFSYNVEASITYANEPIGTNDQLTVEISLEELEFSALFGNLPGRAIMGESDSIDVVLFENVDGGELLLDNPTFTLSYSNGFGIPVEVNLDSVFTQTKDGEIIPISGNILTERPVIQANTLDNIGSRRVTDVVLNKDNSNIVELFSQAPTGVFLNFDGVLNPGNLVTNSFATDSSRIDVSANLTLPLEGVLADFTLRNEYNFKGADLENLRRLEFTFESINGFPFALNIQATFETAEGEILGFLFESEGQLLEPAQVDPVSGEVTEPSVFTTTAFLNLEDIQEILAAQFLVFTATFNTPTVDPPSVKILDSYELDIKIELLTELEI